jgi:hypothetical protein
MRRTGILLAACAALALSACGDDDDSDGERAATEATTTTQPEPGAATETAETEPPENEGEAGGELSGEDRDEIREVVLAAATNREPCEHLTARYKKEFVFEGVTSADPDEACKEAEQGQPELKDSDVEIGDITGDASKAEVKFTIAGIDQSASLVREGDRWLIDKFDF